MVDDQGPDNVQQQPGQLLPEPNNNNSNDQRLARSNSLLGQSSIQRIRYRTQRVLIMAKLVIAFLLRVLLFTWILIAYFMIQRMELSHQADINRQVLILAMIRYLLSYVALLATLFIVQGFMMKCTKLTKN